MRFTPVHCYVLLDLVAQDKLSISRNGALEPHIEGFSSDEHPFSERRLLTAVQDLYDAAMIKFPQVGLFGKYIGKAEIAHVGQRRLHLARRAQQEFREKAERDAFEEKRREELAAFREANQVLKSDEPTSLQEAAARVAEFLRVWPTRMGNHPEEIIVMQVMDREKDDVVPLALNVSDLAALVAAVKR